MQVNNGTKAVEKLVCATRTSPKQPTGHDCSDVMCIYGPSLGLMSAKINDPLGGFLVLAHPSSKDDLTLE